MRVLGAGHGADRPALEALQGRERLAVQGLHRLVLDLVDTSHLLGDQLRVAHDLDLARAQLARLLQTEQQRPVLGDVVRDRAEQLGVLAQHLARGRGDHAGGRRGAGIAAGAAVDVDDHLHRSEYACRLRRNACFARSGVSERGQIPGHAGPATIANHAARSPLGGRRLGGRAPTASAPIELTPVDDHRHVVLVLVVLDELRIQLVGSSGLGTTQ